MASEPHTRFPNALIENALCKINLSPNQWRVMMYVIRHTLGWQRKEFKASLRSIAEATCIDYRNVGRTLRDLEGKFIITTRKAKDYTIVTINADYMSWRIEEKPGLFTAPAAPAPEAEADRVFSHEEMLRNFEEFTSKLTSKVSSLATTPLLATDDAPSSAATTPPSSAATTRLITI